MKTEIVPIKSGSLVINVTDPRKIFRDEYLNRITCKVLSHFSRLNSIYYIVQPIYGDELTLNHNSVLPADEFFNRYENDAYLALDKCDNLYAKDEKFLLRSGYLFNYNNNVILEAKKFIHLFKKKENVIIRESIDIESREESYGIPRMGRDSAPESMGSQVEQFQ